MEINVAKEESEKSHASGAIYQKVCASCSSPAKYSCPKCSTLSCSLNCVKTHKIQKACNGVRDITSFVPVEEFEDKHFYSDYHFLEEVGRKVDNVSRAKRNHGRLFFKPINLDRLQKAAWARRTKLEILPIVFTKRKMCTTFLRYSDNKIFWRLEWTFPMSEVTFSDERVDEEELLGVCLDKYLIPNNTDINEKLEYYQSMGHKNVAVLLKDENTPSNEIRILIMAEQGISQRNWVHDLADFYDETVLQNTHPEVMKWPLVGSDGPALTIVFSYMIFINYVGPAFMKNRKPFDLRWLMVPYNIFLVIINFYIFWEYFKIRLYGRNDLKCVGRLPSGDKENLETYKLAEICWYFYITKYIELIDTVFFVLRKKERQLSRLHKIHHTTVPIMILLMLRGEPGGYNSFFPLANSFVHCVMYTYYGVSALGEHITIHLKFKRYVTMTQMIQFILVLYYFISRPFYGCKWSTAYGVGNLIIAGFFFMLFCNFYWNEYCNSKAEQNGQVKNKEV